MSRINNFIFLTIFVKFIGNRNSFPKVFFFIRKGLAVTNGNILINFDTAVVS